MRIKHVLISIKSKRLAASIFVESHQNFRFLCRFDVGNVTDVSQHSPIYVLFSPLI